MPNSQFTLITNMDSGAPQLYGATGSLISVLDYALVTRSGWLQPTASIAVGGSSVNNLACYKQPSGSGCFLYVNDAAPVTATSGKDAWVVGWETLTSFTSSTVNATGSVGQGTVQFPPVGVIPGLAGTAGALVLVKSNTADTTTVRPWFMYIDDYTFYLFVNDGSVADSYHSLFFGDIYSFAGSNDTQKCMIQAGMLSNNASGLYHQNDVITVYKESVTSYGQGSSGAINRTSDGRPLSNWICKHGDFGKACRVFGSSTELYQPMLGFLSCPSIDKSYYLVPISVLECFGLSSGTCLRGRMRGMYQICHPIVNFTDGQTFLGIGDLFGKRFQIVKQGPNNGIWCIEISNTVETN